MRSASRAEDDQDAEEQQQREKRLGVRGKPLAADYQRTKEHDGGVGEQDLAEPDVETGNAVMEAELEQCLTAKLKPSLSLTSLIKSLKTLSCFNAAVLSVSSALAK